MSEELKLPPLPEPDGVGIDCETDDGSYWYAPAMREYARQAVLAERERAARVCERTACVISGPNESDGEYVLLHQIAAAIRAGAEEKP